MSLTLDQIVEEARALPSDRLAELVDRLAVQLHGGSDAVIDREWSIEIRRRVAEIDGGEAEFFPGEQVMDELRKIAGR